MKTNTKRVPTWALNPLASVDHIGTHITADFWGARTIESEEEIRKILTEAAKRANSTVLEVSVKKFEPQGLTGIVMLAESHLSLHTWPEIGYVAVDAFTCGANVKPEEAIEYLQEVFAPERVEMNRLERGSQKPQLSNGLHSLGENGKYGMELLINLKECQAETMQSKERICQFARELCQVIDMKPFGEPWAERFGFGADFTAGYSLVQLIETSSITGHFSDLWGTAYINIFSCKEYDSKKAIEFTKKFFGAKEAETKLFIR